MAVRVKGWKGIAFYVLGPAMIKKFSPDGDYECEPSEDQIEVVMVGDDRIHIVDKDDCTELPEEDYCSECGQIGCAHGAYS